MVQIDGNTQTVYSATASSFKPQEILFYAGNIGPGSHSLQIQISTSPNQPSSGKLAIDYANVFTTTSLGGRYAVACECIRVD